MIPVSVHDDACKPVGSAARTYTRIRIIRARERTMRVAGSGDDRWKMTSSYFSTKGLERSRTRIYFTFYNNICARCCVGVEGTATKKLTRGILYYVPERLLSNRYSNTTRLTSSNADRML